MAALFGKENNGEVIDKIFINEDAKTRACIKAIKNNAALILAVWFDETYHKMEAALEIAGCDTEQLFYTRQLSSQHAKENIVFAEHYPLSSKEEELFLKLGIQQPLVFSSLDEPLFKHFGGDRISDLIKTMGIQEDEAITHPLITSSIKNFQGKIAEKIYFEQSACSQADWLMINLTA